MQLLLLLPPRDDLPEMPTRDVPVHRVVHNNRPSARQRGRGAAPVNEFIQVDVSVSIELPVRAFIGTTCRTFRRHAKFVHLARS